MNHDHDHGNQSDLMQKKPRFQKLQILLHRWKLHCLNKLLWRERTISIIVHQTEEFLAKIWTKPLQNHHFLHKVLSSLTGFFSSHVPLIDSTSGTSSTSQQVAPTSKRSWYSTAILRLSSMTISASLAALARVSLMKRAVTTRITAKTTKAWSLLDAF